MFEQYLPLLIEYGRHVTVTAFILSFVFLALFSFWYVSSNTEESTGKKLFDVIAMLFYITLFFVYILAGIYLSGNAAIGVSGGIIAFWAMLTFKIYIQRRRADKLREKRREEIERIKRGER